MSVVKIESMTETPEQIQATLGGQKQGSVDAKAAATPAADEKSAETKGASGASEEEAVDESQKDAKDGKDDTQGKKKKGGFQKKVDKLTRRATQAEIERDFWKEKANKADSAGKSTVDAPAEQPAKDLSQKPKSEDFAKHEDFMEALTDWKLAQRDAKDLEKKAEVENQKLAGDHNSRVESFVKDHPDFHDILESADDINVPKSVTNALARAENGPELMYELCKDQEALKAICAASDPVRALGRYEGKFEAIKASAVKQPEKKISSAPPPPNPIGQRGTTVKTLSDDLSYDDWSKLRREQLRNA